ncbi:PVC-type heme-binding CxxCH protein [Siphonobacter curvatus]|uniref:Dehydrogenase n=1 Tax=Siphonobacter curvatus TaxID=2094562 RepID=A0A2S7IFY5_9BACT|nr:PVC-type heme-binding CxxCH protein [Siphonobacter curvatus]PQA54132.1 dehydrogenase [Siphonobacter curvatus]
MKKILAGLAALSLLSLTYCTRQPGSSASQPKTEGRRIEILFLGDNGHHRPIQMAPILMEGLGNKGINLSYTDRLEDLNPENLSKYDGLLVFANWDSLPPAPEKALVDFVKGGKGLIAVHCASWCFRNSSAFVNDMVGGQFWKHGWDTIQPVWAKPDHPAIFGAKQFKTVDETYLHKKLAADNVVLTERIIDAKQAKDKPGQKTEPYTWVRNFGKGRVFYTAYGHDELTWKQTGFHDLMEKGIKWSVGDKVAGELQKLNPKPFVYQEANLPNYEKRPGPQLKPDPLSPEESMKHLQVNPDFTLGLFAAEPNVQHPIALSWDEKGRMFAIVTLDYPNERKDTGGRDYILMLEDTNGDGKADKFTKFADNLSIPTSLVAYDGGFIVSQAPDMLFLKDTDGDGKADVRKVLMTGFGTMDTHAGPSNLHYGFDNWIYGSIGYSGFNGTVGGKKHQFGQGFFRFKPDGSELEYLTSTSNNTWGLAFDETGNLFGSTANNDHGWYMAIPNRYMLGWDKLRLRGGRSTDTHKDMKVLTRIRQVDVFGGYTAAAGHNFYTARSFPQSYWNRVAFVSEPTGHIIHLNTMEKDGTDYHDKNDFNLVAGADEWFSPVFAEVGPDGAVWFADWYSFIIQHNPTPKGFENGGGNAYVTDLRDNTHGRIYRIAYKKAPAYQPLALSKDQPEALVKALTSDNMFWRQAAQRLLVERGKSDVLPQLYALVKNQSLDAIGSNPGAIHALWTLHGLGALNGSNAEAFQIVTAALKHPAASVRKTAVQVLPKNASTVASLLQANTLNDSEPLVGLNTLLAFTEAPMTAEVEKAVVAALGNPNFVADRWMPDAFTTVFNARDSELLKTFLAKAPRQGQASASASTSAAMDHSAHQHGMAEEKAAASTGPKADIVVTQVKPSTPMPTVREGISFSVEVENRGSAAVPSGTPITLKIHAEGPNLSRDWLSYTFVKGLKAGEKAFITESNNGPWVGPMGLSSDVPGNFTISVTADPDNKIPENREDNNTFRYVVKYQPLKNLTGFVLENATRAYTATATEAELLSFAGLLKGLNDTDAKAVLAGMRRGWDPKRKLAPSAATQQVLASLDKDLSKDNQKLLNNWAELTGLRKSAENEVDPNVQTVKIKTVTEKLQFSLKEFTVKAGQPVEIILDNPDQMQHNLVIGKPKSLEVIGKAADAMITRPDAVYKSYVPEIPQVIIATKLVNPDDSAHLKFVAPAEPGDYPFVCTFPGHWRIMNGVMRVVKETASSNSKK